MLTEPVVVALIIASGGVLTGIVAAVVAFLVRLSARLRRLEHRDRLSWLYIRSLIDHAYKHAPGAPLPEPPAGWLEEAE